MKKYYIEMPIVGVVRREIYGEDEQDAINNFYDIEFKYQDEDFEFDYFEKVLEGNVYHGGYSEVYIEELED